MIYRDNKTKCVNEINDDVVKSSTSKSHIKNVRISLDWKTKLCIVPKYIAITVNSTLLSYDFFFIKSSIPTPGLKNLSLIEKIFSFLDVIKKEFYSAVRFLHGYIYRPIILSNLTVDRQCRNMFL